MVASIWKLISLFLALGAFLAVGVICLMAGEDLVWAVGKAVASFFGCWFVFGFLGNVLLSVLERQEVATPTGASLDEKG